MTHDTVLQRAPGPPGLVPFSGEVHPFAARFPMLPEDELAELAEDIRENEQLHPILIDSDGMLLDGRNRLAACALAEVEPWFERYDGDPVALILSANVRRRQMMPGQVAMAAAIGLVEAGRRKNGRWQHGATEEAKLATGSEFGDASLRMAGVVLDYDADQGTDLAGNVLAGTDSLTDTYRKVMAARKRQTEAEEAAEQARRELEATAARQRQQLAQLTDEAPDLAELVRTEKLPLEDAMAAWDNRRRDELAARQEAATAWSEMVDHLTGALAYFENRLRPPEELPEGYPSVASAAERFTRLARHMEGLH